MAAVLLSAIVMIAVAGLGVIAIVEALLLGAVAGTVLVRRLLRRRRGASAHAPSSRPQRRMR